MNALGFKKVNGVFILKEEEGASPSSKKEVAYKCAKCGEEIEGIHCPDTLTRCNCKQH
jgi:hypothetical protein